jgi:hypothetical protein
MHIQAKTGINIPEKIAGFEDISTLKAQCESYKADSSQQILRNIRSF